MDRRRALFERMFNKNSGRLERRPSLLRQIARQNDIECLCGPRLLIYFQAIIDQGWWEKDILTDLNRIAVTLTATFPGMFEKKDSGPVYGRASRIL